jgi:hypothetical protein
VCVRGEANGRGQRQSNHSPDKLKADRLKRAALVEMDVAQNAPKRLPKHMSWEVYGEAVGSSGRFEFQQEKYYFEQ